MDKVYKYIYGDDLKLQVFVLSDCIQAAAEAHNIHVGTRIGRIALAECLAVILAAELKDAGASEYVSFKYPESKKAYNAVAYSDGRVCAAESDYIPPSFAGTGVILETSRHDGAGADYGSAVCGKTAAGAVKEYINASMQREAKYKIIRDGNTYYAVFAEALPGSAKLSSAWKALQKPLFTDVDLKKLPDAGFSLIETREIKYGCNCSRRSVKKALISVGNTDVNEQGGTIEAVCNYCGKKYVFTAEDFEA